MQTSKYGCKIKRKSETTIFILSDVIVYKLVKLSQKLLKWMNVRTRQLNLTSLYKITKIKIDHDKEISWS